MRADVKGTGGWDALEVDAADVEVEVSAKNLCNIQELSTEPL